MDKQQQARAKRKVEGYNLILNLAWSFIFLFPAVVFCYSKMERSWFIISLSISLVVIFLPVSFFNALQLSQSRLFYKKAGVEFFNQFIQYGTILNRIVKNKFPGYKRFHSKEEAFKKLFNQTYLFEKFHFIIFIFFIETAFFALINGYYNWMIFFILANILYNVYPIMLQQYIRLKLSVFKNQ